MIWETSLAMRTRKSAHTLRQINVIRHCFQVAHKLFRACNKTCAIKKNYKRFFSLFQVRRGLFITSWFAFWIAPPRLRLPRDATWSKIRTGCLWHRYFEVYTSRLCLCCTTSNGPLVHYLSLSLFFTNIFSAFIWIRNCQLINKTNSFFWTASDKRVTKLNKEESRKHENELKF